MLASISPLGERARNNLWWLTVGAYALSSTAAGAAAGAMAGLIGKVLIGRSPHTAALYASMALACLAAAGWDAGGRALPPRRQVNEDWLASYRGWIYGAGFGAQLGAGVTTVITTALVPLTFALALGLADPAPAALTGASFGLVRALPVLALYRVTTPEKLRRVHVRMQGAAGTARALAMASALIVGGFLLTDAVLST